MLSSEATEKVGWLLQAQAAGLAAWCLLWGGFGRRHWERAGIGPRLYLPGLALLWCAGWIEWTPGPPFRFINLGLAATLLALIVLSTLKPAAQVLAGSVVLAVLAIMMRGLEPINPSSATLVAWATPEAVVMGLLSSVWGREAWRAALAAGAATGGASLWWAVRGHWGHVGLGPTDWYYTVIAATVAWTGRAVWDLLRPGPRATVGGH